MNFDENYNPYSAVTQDIYADMDADKKGKKKDKKTRKERKGSGFFKKSVAFVGGAVLFGAIAGGVCYGVTYAGYNIFPIEREVADSGKDSYVKPITTPILSDEVKKEISATVMDVSDIVDSVITSVVAIDGTYQTMGGFFGNQTYESSVSGSGIIMGTNDTELLVVTNAHVVDDVDNLAITFYDGSKADAVIKGMKANKDLAVIAVQLRDIPKGAIYSIAELGETTEIKVGDAAIAVGNSLGYGISVTTGCISALNKTIMVDKTEYSSLIQTDAAINPGNSGGALFNAYGEVIGINSVKMRTTGVEGMGYAISISSVKEIINELSLEETRQKYSEDERGYIGITGVNITSDINAMYGYPIGIQVRSVTEGSAADNAGIMKNDIIISFDGEEINDFVALADMMLYYAVGEKVMVEYYRMEDGEYKKHSVELVLTPKPE